MGAGVQVGDVLAEKYEVTRILGMGGMGVVAAAHHRELDKPVALKFMHEEVADEQAIDRFLREARAAARLQSEHVGHVLDVGRRADGVPYLVMEYLEGRDLAQISEQRGPLDVAEVVEYILQACEAMAEAHALGIVHRDLKPRNLFVAMRPDGRPLVKVLDVGISKEQLVPGPDVTHAALGSPAYMSPEHVRSARAVDPRADIWSLGVILYQLLVGSLPFAGATITDVIFRVMIDPAPPLAAARPDLPPGLVAVIERCLEKDRAKRFDSVAALAYELMPFAPARARAPDDDLGSIVPGVTAAPPVAAQTALGAAASRLDGVPRPPGRWWWIGVGLVGIATAVALQTRVDAAAPAGPRDAPLDAPVDAPAPVLAEVTGSASAHRSGRRNDVWPEATSLEPPAQSHVRHPQQRRRARDRACVTDREQP